MKKSKSKPWQLTKWRKKREMYLKSRCEQCGSTEHLLLHHPKRKVSSLSIWKRIAFDMFRESEEFKELVKTLPEINVCSKCSSSQIRKRKVGPKARLPRLRSALPYVCYKCGAEFKSPVKRRRRCLSPYMYRNTFFNFKRKHKDEISKKQKEEDKRFYRWYESLEGAITLCRKCHFLLEKKGLILCKECGKRYHPLRYQTCWECFKKTKRYREWKRMKEREKEWEEQEKEWEQEWEKDEIVGKKSHR